MPGETANPLTPHRVPLVSHRAAANLRFGEGFLNLLQVSEEADIATHLVSGLGNTGESREDVVIDLSRVSLAGHSN